MTTASTTASKTASTTASRTVSARCKRVVDVGVCLLSLPVSAPLAALCAVLVRLSGPGPVLYRATRVGLGGRPFALLKFRTMSVGAGGPGVTRSGDPRITRAGAWLRRTKLDELPQLVNVLRGEMSLVGPRPEDPRFVAAYTPEQRAVLTVLPGVTSLASVLYRHEQDLMESCGATDIESYYVEKVMQDKLGIDLEYVRHRGVGTDLKILVRTVRAVLSSRPERRVA